MVKVKEEHSRVQVPGSEKVCIDRKPRARPFGECLTQSRTGGPWSRGGRGAGRLTQGEGLGDCNGVETQ